MRLIFFTVFKKNVKYAVALAVLIIVNMALVAFFSQGTRKWFLMGSIKP